MDSPVFISKVIFSDLDYPPSCTFLGHTLKLCKDSLIVIHLFRKTCSYEKYGPIDRQGDCNLTPKTVLRGLYKKSTTPTYLYKTSWIRVANKHVKTPRLTWLIEK